MARLKEIYNSEIKEAMQKKFNYKNVNEIPKLEKIVINMGVGEAKENSKVLDSAVRDLEIITGQHAVTTKARKSVANFKIREGQAIGCKVTLRGEKMPHQPGSSSSKRLPWCEPECLRWQRKLCPWNQRADYFP